MTRKNRVRTMKTIGAAMIYTGIVASLLGSGSGLITALITPFIITGILGFVIVGLFLLVS